MRILRWFLVLSLLFFSAGWAAVRWVESPAGARFLSDWLTAQVQASAAGTRVDLERVRLHWPPALTAERAVWSGKDGRPIAVLARVRAVPAWQVEAQVLRLDLSALDQAVGKGEWRSDGFMRGAVRVRGKRSRLEDVELDLRSEQPGGHLNSEILERLARMMPPGDARGALLRALAAKATFHFDVGKVEMTTEGENVVLNLLLDGDHLLDLKIRVGKDSLQLLKVLMG